MCLAGVQAWTRVWAWTGRRSPLPLLARILDLNSVDGVGYHWCCYLMMMEGKMMRWWMGWRDGIF
jgi:hypothetical protein